MKKILAILIALLAALSVQTVAFADGELLPQTAETQGETSNGAVVLAEGSIEHNGINYTVLTVPSGEENGTVEVGRNETPAVQSPSLRPSQMVKILTPLPPSVTVHFQCALA